MLISLFPTPFGHFQFLGSAGQDPKLILTLCLSGFSDMNCVEPKDQPKARTIAEARVKKLDVLENYQWLTGPVMRKIKT